MRYVTWKEAFGVQYKAAGIERLQALAAFLETLPPDRLTLVFWFNDGRGCAIGLAAATEPWFQAQGLRLEDIDQPALCHPVYREKSDWDAVAAFFELSVEACRQLFSAGAYDCPLKASPGLIAQRIRRHLSAEASAGNSPPNRVPA